MKEITEALNAHPAPWRHGHSVGRTLYDAHDKLIGMVDTPELATLVVMAVNQLAQPPEAPTLRAL